MKSEAGNEIASENAIVDSPESKTVAETVVSSKRKSRLRSLLGWKTIFAAFGIALLVTLGFLVQEGQMPDAILQAKNLVNNADRAMHLRLRV